MKFLIVILIFFLVLIKADQQCTSDSSCEELSHCVNQKCIHKGLFPLATTEYVGTAAMMIISCIGNAGGIGGSAISISLMLLLFKFVTWKNVVGLIFVHVDGRRANSVVLKIKQKLAKQGTNGKKHYFTIYLNGILKAIKDYIPYFPDV